MNFQLHINAPDPTNRETEVKNSSQWNYPDGEEKTMPLEAKKIIERLPIETTKRCPL